ncbi:hypothetical protein [Phyllobacterium sp. SB3]|uniref:hypothetical protein n=1 Tax=Phyllobacterium sp. SB3 TaxID=3156073 RepID=UPI0032AEAB15
MKYADEMRARLPATMRLPDEFEALFDWIEANGFFMPSGRFPGDRLGMLCSSDGPHQGTVILLRIETAEQAQESGEAWLGNAVPDVAERLVPFARTGGDGSYAAFWMDDTGQQQIVNLGSEGQVCILAPTPLDFLRLLGIGYEEISGDCLYDPNAVPDDSGGRRIVVNDAYRTWLTSHYDVTIPRTASEIVGNVPDSSGATSSDPFWRWVHFNQAKRNRD